MEVGTKGQYRNRDRKIGTQKIGNWKNRVKVRSF